MNISNVNAPGLSTSSFVTSQRANNQATRTLPTGTRASVDSRLQGLNRLAGPRELFPGVSPSHTALPGPRQLLPEQFQNRATLFGPDRSGRFAVSSAMQPAYHGEEKGSSILPGVTYFSPEQRERHQINISNGLMLHGDGTVLDTAALNAAIGSNVKSALFVMAPTGEIYVGAMVLGKIQHSSFLAGASVPTAGEIIVENGVIKKVTDRSGHYRPLPEQLKQFQFQLRSSGVAYAYEVQPFAQNVTRTIGALT